MRSYTMGENKVTEEAQHTIRMPAYKVTHWTANGTACTDEEWHTRVVMTHGAFPLSECFYSSDADRRRFNTFTRFLDHTYEIGKANAMQELRDFIGVKQPR